MDLSKALKWRQSVQDRFPLQDKNHVRNHGTIFHYRTDKHIDKLRPKDQITAKQFPVSREIPQSDILFPQDSKLLKS